VLNIIWMSLLMLFMCSIIWTKVLQIYMEGVLHTGQSQPPACGAPLGGQSFAFWFLQHSPTHSN
jgi:hypothetical protein